MSVDSESDNDDADAAQQCTECRQLGQRVMESFFTMHQETSTVSLADLEKNALHVRDIATRLPSSILATDTYVAELPGFMNHVLTHVCLAMDSVQFRSRLSDQYARTSCLVILAKDTEGIKTGKASGGAFRMILSLRDVVATLNDSLMNTIPQLMSEMPDNATDKTRTPMDVVKLNLANLRAWWMQGDGYSIFEHRFERALWFIQAIEVNTPKLKTDSHRYQFQTTLIDQWPSKLKLFIDGLRQIATDAFARLKFGYKPDVPYPILCPDDMPVVVRDQSVIKTNICYMLSYFPNMTPSPTNVLHVPIFPSSGVGETRQSRRGSETEGTID